MHSSQKLYFESHPCARQEARNNIHLNTIKAHSQAPVSPETPETLPGSWAKRQTSEVGLYFRASFIIIHLGIFNPMSLTDAPFCGDCLI